MLLNKIQKCTFIILNLDIIKTNISKNMGHFMNLHQNITHIFLSFYYIKYLTY